MPPSEALAPGSMGKNRPLSRSCSLSSLRVMPACTTQSRASAGTVTSLFMSRMSIDTPPCGALTWPSSEEPVPNGMIGILCRAQMRTTCCTSSVDCGKMTASGAWLAIQVTVLPCCSRTAREVTTRLPNAAVRSAMAAAKRVGLEGSATASTVTVKPRLHKGHEPQPVRAWHSRQGPHSGRLRASGIDEERRRIGRRRRRALARRGGIGRDHQHHDDEDGGLAADPQHCPHGFPVTRNDPAQRGPGRRNGARHLATPRQDENNRAASGVPDFVKNWLTRGSRCGLFFAPRPLCRRIPPEKIAEQR